MEKLLIQQDISFNDKKSEFKLLDILKKEFYPGPFYSVEDVQNYMNNTPENQVKKLTNV